jgi:multimeric flavodoxin WrbA
MDMKAVILLGTLKKDEQSNTEALTDFFIDKMAAKGVTCEKIRLVSQHILPGTYSDMGQGDDWPAILKKILAAEIVIFATPVWWGSHSSEIQRVIERLDNIHDEILEGKPSQLADKVGGIIITGDSDGAEQIIGVISNFLNAIGVLVPPYATLSVLWEGQKKGGSTPRKELIEKYVKEYAGTAEKMAAQLVKFAGS